MSEVPGSRSRTLAIGCAVLALSVSLIAMVVAVTRSPSAPAATAPAASTPELQVPARDLVKLTSTVDDTGHAGVRVTDPELRRALALGEDDVIVNLAGRAIERRADAEAAITGAARLRVSILHADVLRADKTVAHLRWQVDGDLRAAQHADATPARPNPYAIAGRDPLLDTIRKVDELHYVVPRSTVERIVANLDDFAKGARVVPAMRGGLPEGFKLYAVRPTSLFAAIGLQNGDTIRAINGNETTSLDKLLEAYLNVKDAKELAIDITRRGRYELVSISIQ